MEEEIRHILRNAAKESSRPIATNVLSALMREVPERPVVEWLDRQAADSIWITSITFFDRRPRRPPNWRQCDNARHFSALNVAVINPWEAHP
jgi:hypothetical protein